MKRIGMLGSAALAVLLAACGGGSSDGDGDGGGQGQGSSASVLQGMWDGESTAGVDLGVLIEDSGAIWGFSVDEGYLGLLHGAASASGSDASGSVKEFDIFGGTVVPGTLKGSFVEKQSITGTITSSGTIGFSLAYDADYEKKASLAALQGAWTLGTAAFSMNATIGADGSFQGKNVIQGSVCEYSGKLAPHASRNYYQGNLTFAQGTSCIHAGKAMTGVAILGSDDEDAYLVAGFVDAAETAGVVFAGTQAVSAK